MLCTLCYRAGTICQWEIDWRLALRRLRSEDIRKERAVVSDFDAPCRGSLQNSWRNDGCGSRFGGRLFPGLSIMKPETLQEFKQFLAEEWGIGVEEISDKQGKSRPPKRE